MEGRAWARRHLGPAPLLLLLLALFAFLLALPLLLLPPPPTSHTLYAALCCPALKLAAFCYPPLQHSAQRDRPATGKRKERGLVPAQVLFSLARPFLLASVPAPPKPQPQTPRLSKSGSVARELASRDEQTREARLAWSKHSGLGEQKQTRKPARELDWPRVCKRASKRARLA